MSFPTPKRLASILLGFIILTMSFADDLEYGKAYRREPGIFLDVLGGTATAPSQYRVGVLQVAAFLSGHTHLALRHWLTLIGMGSALTAVFALFSLLQRTSAWQKTSEAGRWFAAAAFVILVQYYFAWVTYFQRPETLPTAMLVALVILLISMPLPRLVVASGILLLAVIQGLVRADIAVALHLGLLLLCATRANPGLSLSRFQQIATSILAIGAAAGVQVYMMKVRYPHASYGTTAAFQLPLNLTSPGEWTAFLLFILPFAWTVVTLARRHATLASPAIAVIYAAVIYLGFWLTLGRMEEVRIFLPMALAVAPITVTAALQRLHPEFTPSA